MEKWSKILRKYFEYSIFWIYSDCWRIYFSRSSAQNFVKTQNSIYAKPTWGLMRSRNNWRNAFWELKQTRNCWQRDEEIFPVKFCGWDDGRTATRHTMPFENSRTHYYREKACWNLCFVLSFRFHRVEGHERLLILHLNLSSSYSFRCDRVFNIFYGASIIKLHHVADLINTTNNHKISLCSTNNHSRC